MSDEQIESSEGKLTKLPEWRACLDVMLKEGVEYGKVYSAEFFEEHLCAKRDEMDFEMRISEIRRALEHKGFYLTGRGGKGVQWVILPAKANQNVMRSYNRAAADAMKRGVILGTNTPLDLLSEQERRSHEATLEKMATRQILLQRSESIRKLVEKEKPKLLTK